MNNYYINTLGGGEEHSNTQTSQMATIMVIKIIIINTICDSGSGGGALGIGIACNHYGYKKIMHINSTDYRFLGGKVHLEVTCRGNGTQGGFTIKKYTGANHYGYKETIRTSSSD